MKLENIPLEQLEEVQEIVRRKIEKAKGKAVKLSWKEYQSFRIEWLLQLQPFLEEVGAEIHKRITTPSGCFIVTNDSDNRAGVINHQYMNTLSDVQRDIYIEEKWKEL